MINRPVAMGARHRLIQGGKDENGSDTAECLNHSSVTGARLCGPDIGGHVYLSRRQAGPGQILAITLFRGPRHQHGKDDRNENERRRISHQMTAFSRIAEALNAHDRPMNYARPHGEPDKALVSIGIS